MIRHFPAAFLLAPLIACAATLAANAADDPAIPVGIPADQAAELAAKIEKHRKKYGADMLCAVDPELKLLFVMGTDQRSLDETRQRLSAHAAALQRDLFKHKPAHYLSVIVPRKWANPKVTGHFWPDFVDASTTGSNLMHEFTHTLHYADQVGRGEYQPVWIMEGFASMYEKSEVVDGHAVPLVNRRLVRLQEEVRNEKFLPFEKMMNLQRRRFTSHHYAQARYMCMYFHATGKLPEWYATYTAGFADDPSGIAATEKIYGKQIAEIEQDWIAWVLKLEPPRLIPGPGAASLGIAGRQLPDAVEITQLAPEGAAKLAGLAPGDALIRVAGERTIEMEDLVTTMARHQTGDTAKIEYRRDGHYYQTTATLAPLPAMTPPSPGQ